MKKGRFLWDESRILPYDFMGTKMKGWWPSDFISPCYVISFHHVMNGKYIHRIVIVTAISICCYYNCIYYNNTIFNNILTATIQWDTLWVMTHRAIWNIVLIGKSTNLHGS
jgi:hypothetical protein